MDWNTMSPSPECKHPTYYREILETINDFNLNTNAGTPDTPRSKTKQILKNAGLSKHQSAKVRKQLLLANVVQAQIENRRLGIKRMELDYVRGLKGGKILSKYKLGSEVSKLTVENTIYRNRRQREVERYRAHVLEFLMRDDNSRCNPGKQDKLKINGETRQTRILTDYLKNLHLKFLSENPEVKLSLASFCRLRPAHIKLTKFISRSCCFCTKHQTFALCTQALRKCGIDVPLNPEKCIEDAANIEKNERKHQPILHMGNGREFR
ncbi:hypothetical protein MAR_034437 [Mya arenaria]|uniref:Uncharacterized protein n=1 Tax=Mya arenaria TaxID=6604 RepID=A0ABY7GBW0_MYAAR|nr:hypothetical protein MAR_034437 [Mya arenaria]